MLRKLFLIPAVLSLACLLATANFAEAQRRGGGGYRGGGYRGGYGGGVGVYIGPGWGYGGYYRPYYAGGYVTPSYSYYYDPGVTYVQPGTYVAPAPMDYANIRVNLPDAAARVWFDGNATQQTGTNRLFSTPTLTQGATATYTIRAAWMQQGREVTQERQVSVGPGQTFTVDFTRPVSEKLLPPK